MGLVTYCAKFIPNLADLSKPQRDLTTKNARWRWTEAHESAFRAIQDQLTCDQTLTFYRPEHPTTVLVDGSPTGVAAILTQTYDNRTHIVAYASRSLSPVEQRYSQLEREALAILFGCERFRLYLIGSHFTVVTDHKPLLPIFTKPHTQPSARIERWLLRLQPYDLTLEYQPGKQNPVDYMSRHPVSPPPDTLAAEEHVNFVISTHTPVAVTQTDIENASSKDPVIQKIIQAVKIALGLAEAYSTRDGDRIIDRGELDETYDFRKVVGEDPNFLKILLIPS